MQDYIDTYLEAGWLQLKWQSYGPLLAHGTNVHLFVKLERPI